MRAPFFLVGPTAVGKSRLAVKVAAEVDAEIIGADAFQIYAGFDLLTAKPSREEQCRVPHHLLGTVSPALSYNVARYLEDVRPCQELIFNRGKRVIVVGGTGLYVKALTHGLSPLPEADPAIRAELEALDLPALRDRLRVLDPASADKIDVQNKRRLVRAIEVCVLTGHPFSAWQILWPQSSREQTPNGVFLVRSKADLHARIERRVAAMFAEGVVDEVRAVDEATLSPTASRMIGWQDIRDFLAGEQTLDGCRENIVRATRQYAKRQVTWFQREKSFEKIDLSALAGEQEQVALISERLLAFERQTSS